MIEAKQKGSDPFVTIENVISWDTFTQSLTDTQKLAPSEDFDYLEHIKNGYSQIRRYAPALLDILQLKANPALGEVQVGYRDKTSSSSKGRISTILENIRPGE